MRSAFACSLLLLCPLLAAAEPDRSPVDLVLGPDAAWLVTANQTAGTASLVRIADGQVLDEAPAGRHPIALALAADGRTVLVSGHWSGDVHLLEVRGEKLVPTGRIDVGYQPHGLAIAPDGRTAFVACTASAQVAVLDLPQRKVTARIDVGRWPRHVALSPDGKRLAVGTSGDRGMTVVDAETKQALFQEKFLGLNIGQMQVSRDGGHVYFPWMVYRHNPITSGNIRLGWVLASRIARLRLDGPSRREAISLDPPGKAIADPHGLGITPDDQWVVVSAAGTHELLVYRHEGIPFKDYGGTDHLEPELQKDRARFDRIELGGRPMGLRVAPDSRTVFVANYLDNSVQVVDVVERKLVRTLPLGGPAEPSLARRGEAIFYDGRRSLDQWYSCHSCHYEGGVNAEQMDTLNDGSPFTFKTVLPLHQLTETSPWTWHGWQTDLRNAMRKSLTETMLGPSPSAEDIDALIAYFGQLQLPPNPFRRPDGSLTEAAERGQKVFTSEKAGCANCHSGPHFTDGQVHDVGLGRPSDRYRGYNTPTLRGVYQKVRLLHDGQSATLEEVLAGPHNPAKVTGQGELTPEERSDLIEYLKSL